MVKSPQDNPECPYDIKEFAAGYRDAFEFNRLKGSSRRYPDYGNDNNEINIFYFLFVGSFTLIALIGWIALMFILPIQYFESVFFIIFLYVFCFSIIFIGASFAGKAANSGIFTKNLFWKSILINPDHLIVIYKWPFKQLVIPRHDIVSWEVYSDFDTIHTSTNCIKIVFTIKNRSSPLCFRLLTIRSYVLRLIRQEIKKEMENFGQIPYNKGYRKTLARFRNRDSIFDMCMRIAGVIMGGSILGLLIFVITLELR